MVRQAYYLRREKYNSARDCVDDLHKKENCILSPKTLIAFERGNTELDDITLKSLAKLFGADMKEICNDDGKDWRKMNVVHGK